ncbi:MAG TPA: phospholipase [Phenylobacterium sp.]|nr:phospholipase [Phenylobacterium sp.]
MTTLPTLNGPSVAPAYNRAPKSLVILLHGYGSNGADLIGLVPHWQHAFPDTLFISPNAPQPMPAMLDAYQWWPITNMDAQARINGARQPAPVLNAFIDQQLAILLIHGDADPMVPVAALHHAGATLQKLGFEVGGHVSPGLGHSIDMEGLQMGGNFLHKFLA